MITIQKLKQELKYLSITDIYYEGPYVVLHTEDDIQSFDYTYFLKNFNTRLIFKKNIKNIFSYSKVKEYLKINIVNNLYSIKKYDGKIYITKGIISKELKEKINLETGWVVQQREIYSNLRLSVEHDLESLVKTRKDKLHQLGLKIREKSEEIIEIYTLTCKGGFNQIGRSNYYIKLGTYTIMVEAGIKNSSMITEPIFPYKDISDINLAKVDAAIISHAHVDHSGFLPYLLESAHYDGIIYLTQPTRDIIYKVFKQTMKFKSEIRSYSLSNFLTNSCIIDLGRNIEILPGLTINFKLANHFLGAVMIHFKTRRNSFLFTGDFKYTDRLKQQNMFKPLDPKVFNYDYNSVLTEITYGDIQNRKTDAASEMTSFISLIKKCNEERNNVLIPVFAIGREYLVYTCLIIIKELKASNNLNLKIHVDKTIVDSLLLFKDHPNFVLLDLVTETLDLLEKYNENLNTYEKFIIIAPSGMCDGGPIQTILKNYVDKKDTYIIFTGYQAPDTLGSMIRNKEITSIQTSDNESVSINCQIATFSICRGHTDYDNSFKFWKRLKISDRLIFTHGYTSFISSISGEWNVRNKGMRPFAIHPLIGDTLFLGGL